MKNKPHPSKKYRVKKMKRIGFSYIKMGHNIDIRRGLREEDDVILWIGLSQITSKRKMIPI